MDDGIAAGKSRERLRRQQAVGIGNRANGSHHARPADKMSRARREPVRTAASDVIPPGRAGGRRLRQLNFSIIEIFFDSTSNYFNRLATSERTNFCRLARTCYYTLSWGLECIPVRVVEHRTLAAGCGQVS
jgi:hypothetical protein